MTKKYVSNVSLTLVGPVLTAATGPVSYGLQKSFHRDHQDRPTIPSSHIKGKLKMALGEIAAYSGSSVEVDMTRLFGEPSAEGRYEPVPGILKFSDFKCDAEEHSSRRTRTAIDPKSGTAAEYQLRDVEELFLSGSTVLCVGSVSFFAEGQEDALKITQALRLGFKWLPNLGAEKGVGFGRLQRVSVADPEEQSVPNLQTSTLTQDTGLHLRIAPSRPIMVGGAKKRRTNFVASERILTGRLIKGALATSLNRAHGIRPVYRALSSENAAAFPGFETLVSHFARIRVSHAFPSYTGEPRPIRVPLSTVQTGDRYADTALSSEPFPLIDQRAPAFPVDWKTPKAFFGGADPKEIFVTRTAIDNVSRRSLAGQLFTYSYLCPEDEDGKPVEWVGNVDFSEIDVPAVRHQVKREFARAVYAYLDRLGKYNRRVKVEVRDGLAPSAQGSKDLIEHGVILVTLQSDAIMVDPEQVRQLSPAGDLHDLYAAYWGEISKDVSSSPCLELNDFFAQQTFEGGYFYHRYLGAAERAEKPDQYCPYYLTCAGSVFKLRAVDEARARAHLARWVRSGLDLPEWAKAAYGRYGRPLWKNCPFVPENGYGEIAINLDWHWTAGLT